MKKVYDAFIYYFYLTNQKLKIKKEKEKQQKTIPPEQTNYNFFYKEDELNFEPSDDEIEESFPQSSASNGIFIFFPFLF